MKNIYNIRTLAVEMVEKAKSGHPGAPLGLAPFVYTLYTEFLAYHPNDHSWEGRDIFILSNGHACAIQYVMNYLVGYMNINDIKTFRQIGSRTPGHPEAVYPGIEASTGPLGQGLANSVGYALSLKKLNMSNKVYCVFGDGCYQEGIGQEAFSLAANFNLDNITFIYDYNKITIDGPTDLSMNEDVEARFRSLGFTVIKVDGENVNEIRDALSVNTSHPKVIILDTLIGRDCILENSCKAHGSPIGEEGVMKLKERYGIPQTEFYVSDELKNTFKQINQKKLAACEKYKSTQSKFKLSNLCDNIFKDDELSSGQAATRKIFSDLLNKLIFTDNIICGSADLLASTLCKINTMNDFTRNSYSGSYINFGIREHAMCGVMNGIAHHGYFIPFGGTFLNFITYGFPSVRLASMDLLNTVYVLTHDSIGLGEDGPTHQPIETLGMLRATPNLITMRPCDERECRAAMRVCFAKQGPKAVILTRQKVPLARNSNEDRALKGAYFLIKEESPDLSIIVTGSEVDLGYQVIKELKEYKVSLVSMFSFELFEEQSNDYKQEIMQDVPRVSIEALGTFGWDRYSKMQVGMDRFGASGKAADVFEFFGFSANKIAAKIRNMMNKH